MILRSRVLFLQGGGLFGLSLLGLVIAIVAWLSLRAAPVPEGHAGVWLKLLLVAPLVEEVFFRTVVHAGLRSRSDVFGHAVVANLLVAVAFGAMHLWAAPWFHAGAVMFPALLIGWVYERSRSVGLCVVLHSLCNLLWIVGGQG